MKEVKDEETYDKTPNEVITEFSDKGSSLHDTPYTFRVWNDWIDIVSDHRLVPCENVMWKGRKKRRWKRRH